MWIGKKMEAALLASCCWYAACSSSEPAPEVIEEDPTDTTWGPSGWLPTPGDEYLKAYTDLITMYCCQVSLDTGFSTRGCTRSNYWLVVPRIHWLSCVVRLSGESQEVADYLRFFERALVRNAACRVAEECRVAECGTFVEPRVPAAVDSCPAKATQYCPDGTTFTAVHACDGTPDCTGGFDELNCPPTEEGFECARGEHVEWLQLCDGTADCSNGADESTCGPTPQGQ